MFNGSQETKKSWGKGAEEKLSGVQLSWREAEPWGVE